MYYGNKKMANFCVLEVLKEYSDEKNLLTANDIIYYCNQKYNISLERKTASANIDALIDAGYDITKTPKGCYLGQRDFEPSEISFLVDAIFSSKSLSSKRAQELAQKISGCLSRNERRKYNYIYKASQLARSKNDTLFYTIDILNEAIEKSVQVEFNYNRYYFDKTKQSAKSNRKFIINPYYLINNQGRYYLVCNYQHYNNISNYKVDLISNIKLTNKPAKPITDLDGCQNFDIIKYANENIYMFSNNTIDATLKIYDDHAADYVADWFGGNAKFYQQNGQTFADIKANEQALIYWCLQYGETVELISPSATRDKIKQYIDNLNKKYK